MSISKKELLIDRTMKEIIDVLDETPAFLPHQFDLVVWITNYYMCSYGEVVTAALPSGLKLSSDSFLTLNPLINYESIILTHQESLLIRKLSDKEITVPEVKKLLGIDDPIKFVKSLEKRGLIHLIEKIKEKYKPKKERRIRLGDDYLEEEKLDDLLEQLGKNHKQIDLLVSYLQKVNVFEDQTKNALGLSKKSMVKAGASTYSLKTLIKKGVFVEWDAIIERFGAVNEITTRINPTLSPAQALAKEETLQAFESNSTVLLHGVTGSGKTEVYISLISEIINQGGKVLYLLPEIALTTQIITRLKKHFGDQFGIYHSKFSDNERVEVWRKCLKGEYQLVVGVRSAVFLPIDHLELIIVDEEHDQSFKQHDPAPRYNARDVAVYLGIKLGVKVLLGSATPSLESWQNVKAGKYGIVQLMDRYNNQPMPLFKLVDMTKERKKRTLKGNFSSVLIENLHLSTAEKKQTLLFQNRRGYAPSILCETCGHSPKCPNCSVSLTYHIYHNTLNCHYCGYKDSMHTSCESCGDTSLKTQGAGTEKIEEELQLLCPDLRIKRMDLDTTRNRYSHQEIINSFEKQAIDVLIGTQMISKGLDFEHVNLVGIFDADRMIHFPDFRSSEKAFQMITQVGGRSGRKHKQGKVIVQTNDTTQKILRQVVNNLYEEFANDELKERFQFHYPPFYRLIIVIVRHKDKQVAYEAADQFFFFAKKELNQKISTPIEPIVNKVRTYYRYQLFVRLNKKNINLQVVKQYLQSCKDTLLALQNYKSIRIHFDVDPI